MNALDTSAILITSASDPALGALVDQLVTSGVTTRTVASVAGAIALGTAEVTLPAILLDLREASGGGHAQLARIAREVRAVGDGLPFALPVTVLSAATPSTIVACLRAGAGDVLDLGLDDTMTARQIVQRICTEQRTRLDERAARARQHEMIEDLLKDLILTERRSIDAEDLLARGRRDAEGNATEREPTVLVVEADHDIADLLAEQLEAAGVTTYAYVDGEEAVRELETLRRTTDLDLALVAAQLPGIDGLETIRRLRARIDGLPAFLITSVVDADLAARAADLGVVGFVQKPFADLDEVIARLTQLAHDAVARARERSYVERIKERHERVLVRYRQLPRQP